MVEVVVVVVAVAMAITMMEEVRVVAHNEKQCYRSI